MGCSNFSNLFLE